MYWFCHTSTCIHHRYTRVPHPEPPSLLPPHNIFLSHPHAPAPSMLHPASDIDWRFISHDSIHVTHRGKASILQRSAFFTVQLSHPYMNTGKTIALTGWTFVGKVMSLLFNMLSRLFIAFLSRSKCLLISWLQLPSAVILEPKKIKSVTVSIVSPSICHETMDWMP